MTALGGSRVRFLARSLRVSNRKLREAGRWAPRYPSAREGWKATVDEIRGVAVRDWPVFARGVRL